MTAIAGASSMTEYWNSIEWKLVEQSVRRLQMRIAQAVQQKRWNKVKSLQWLLTHSYHAKLLAVKRVTSNKGKNTPGVDGVVWRTPTQKMRAARSLRRHGYRPLPLRRTYIPKRNGKKRPLSIPTMYDRAMQAIYMSALVPVAETLADGNSYGFREYRRCADAIEYCHKCLSTRYGAEYILEGDIKSCFDKISHEWLRRHIPMDTQILNKFLTAGYMEQGKYYHTRTGTPQGGIISAVLANMTLDGMEKAVHMSVPQGSKVNFVRYADDFIVTAKSKELLVEKVIPTITLFLRERGLELSPEKTAVSHIETGFDFLGQNVRKYKVKPWGKLFIKPAKSSIKRVRENIRQTLKMSRGWKAEAMIEALNKRIRGWAYYHRHIVSKETFKQLDYFLYNSLWRWVSRRHPKKSRKWLYKKYWLQGKGSPTFSVLVREGKGQLVRQQRYQLIRLSSIRIRRHIKVRSKANPYDPQWSQYFDNRKRGDKSSVSPRGKLKLSSEQ